MSSDILPMADNDDRSRGFLTTENREYLRGKKEDSSRQAKSHHRTEIRKRLHNALLDFSVVFDHMDDEEIQKVLGDSTGPHRTTWKDDEIAEGVRDTLAFVLREAGIGAELSMAKARSSIVYQDLLYASLTRIGDKQSRVIHSVDLEVEASKVDIERLKTKLESEGREGLTYAEIGVLAAEGELPDEF